MKGSRVQSVIRELRGEKIDIVQWSTDPLQFVQNSLNPAKINRVGILDEEERLLEVVVSEDQLSLAIGKKGQNVRLASRLTGWKIDIKSEAEKVREVEREMEHLARSRTRMRELPGVGEVTAERLIAAGFDTLEDLAHADQETLSAVPGIGEATAEKLMETAAAASEELYLEEQERYAAEDEARRQAEEEARMAADEEARQEAGTLEVADLLAMEGEEVLEEAQDYSAGGAPEADAGEAQPVEEPDWDGDAVPEETAPEPLEAAAADEEEAPGPESAESVETLPATPVEETEPVDDTAGPSAPGEDERKDA
jgi:N utilization substance protein A